MKGDPEERAAAVGRYIVESGATVRAEATRRKYLHTASCAAHGGTV